ncbi:MAG: FHA domain-containing protein [Ketobacter sp.]|uniref:FHA domain-containing protein n=1 Tax=Ketobacter sp. MCCC 1A13808 TaxID=2602738 RepID=UPI0018DB9869|nr:FHA domain-containing protein [Ketobacter sp. MCCC 1A13808]
MAIKRGPDGVPIDIPSTVKRDRQPKGGTSTGGEDPTLPPRGQQAQPVTIPNTLFPDDPPTAPPKRSVIPDQTATNKIVPDDDPPTVINRGRRKPISSSGQTEISAAESVDGADAMTDPVAGWLVVIQGPGKGNFVKLGYGQNSIGRSPNERVSVDFGDSQISRSNHAMVTYDPRGNRFYIQQGSGTNLAYVNEAPVLTPMELEPYSHILLGDTVLRFVPLCGEGFTWD